MKPMAFSKLHTKNRTTTMSFSVLTARYLVLFTILIVLSGVPTSTAYAWGKAIWPFNTPTMVARQICRNMSDHVDGWTKNRMNSSHQLLSEVLSNISEMESLSIKDDDLKYEQWHRIYWREMRSAAFLIWRNPDTNSNEAGRIASEYCEAKKPSLVKELERTDPK